MNRILMSRLLIASGIALILCAEFLYWHNGVVYRGFMPMGMPLFSGATAPLLFCPLSYGMGVLFLLAWAYLARELRRPVALAWSAFFLLLLGLNLPMQIAFSQPSWVFQYFQGRNQFLQFIGFADTYSLPSITPIIFASEIDGIESLYDRFYAAWLSLEVGWTFYLLGSLLFLTGALGMVGDWQVLRSQVSRAGGFFLLFLTWHLAGPLAGETCFQAGLQAECSGNLQEAKNFYYIARWLDQWNRLNPRVYIRLGAIAEAEQRLDAPEYHLLQGLRNERWNWEEAALVELRLAMDSTDPDLAHVARIAYADYATIFGTVFYSAGGAPGAAADIWQLAGQVSDNSILQDYLAARGYQDAGEYGLALKNLARAQGKTDNFALQTNVLSSTGDVYYFRGDVATGREQYLQSILLVQNYIQYKNIRANKSLTDNLQP